MANASAPACRVIQLHCRESWLLLRPCRLAPAGGRLQAASLQVQAWLDAGTLFISARGQTISQPGRLRQAVAGDITHHQLRRSLQADPVAWRNDQGSYFFPATQYGADLLAAPVQEIDLIAALLPKRLMLASKYLLGDANGRQAGDDTKVGGDTQATRVGNAMAIGEDQVRHLPERFERRQHRRQFAKRQQAGNVGHPGGNPRQCLCYRSQGLCVEQHDSRAGHRTTFFETDVDTGY